MKRIAILVQVFMLQAICFGQKPVITDSSYKDWVAISNVKLSTDGRYTAFSTYNNYTEKTTQHIKATNNSWAAKSGTFGAATITNDSKSAYYISSGYLVRLELGKSKLQTVAKTNGFQLFSWADNQYITYKLDSAKTIVIANLLTGDNMKFSNVEDFKINPYQSSVLLKMVAKNQSEEILNWVDLGTGKIKQIYAGSPVSKIIFSKDGQNAAFATKKDSGNALFYYQSTFPTAKQILENNQVKAGQSITIDDVWEFSEDGTKLYFTTPPKLQSYKQTDTDPVIWNYKDKTIFPMFKSQGFRQSSEWRYLSVIELSTLKVTQLLFNNECRGGFSKHGNQCFVMKSVDTSDHKMVSYYLVDEKSGTRTLIKSTRNVLYDFQFSPDSKFVTYRDEEIGGYLCFDKSTGSTYDFTTLAVSDELYVLDTRTRKGVPNFRGIIGWIKGTSHILIQGMYGIWELDVRNQDQPKKLTPTNQADSHTFFALCTKTENAVIDPAEDLYVYGINNDTKSTSLYRLSIQKQQFSRIYAGDFFWSLPYENVRKDYFQKATKANAFVVSFQSTDNMSNLLFTKDFKRFDTLTSLHPEKQYNWLTSELHTYKDSLGNICQGILYKPENFDPSKKYPVIFNFYQTESNNLHAYLNPQPVGAELNIPELVSNGYLVFNPDIYISKNEFGKYLLLSMDAAVDHLASFHWVDTTKMGISGHSYGGYEVNYLVTHSQRFKAALSGAGFSSIVNNIFDFGESGEEIRFFAETNSQMGVSFEDNPRLYIDNSPIFKTKDVHTPVLLLHAEDDRNVPFYHGLQFFLSLRHLEKPAWLLSYKNGGHGVTGVENQLDYQRKTKSFFDHYLKSAPMPDWMIEHH